MQGASALPGPALNRLLLLCHAPHSLQSTTGQTLMESGSSTAPRGIAMGLCTRLWRRRRGAVPQPRCGQ